MVGEGSATPLLVLHGGPGMSHDYMEPLEALASERPVMFFDHLGCGNSNRVKDPSLLRIERYALEVVAAREALHLDRVHLLGHSSAGWLAIE
jgi:proline iminopeptidase